MLPVDDHGRCAAAIKRDVENGIVPGLTVEDLVDLLGIDRNRNGVLERPVNNGGDQTAPTQPAGLILASGRARFGGDGNFFSHLSLLKPQHAAVLPPRWAQRVEPGSQVRHKDVGCVGPAMLNKQSADARLLVNRLDSAGQQRSH